MKTKNQFTLLLPFLGMLVGLWLTPNLADAQSLEEYLQEATKTNPGLKASYERYQAATERVNQVSLPDPEFQVGVFLRPMERFMGIQTADTRLMQEFPWFGMLRTQKEEAYQMAQVAYFEYLEEKNQLLLQLRSTWQELMLLQGQNQLTQANLEYLKKYEDLALLQYSAGSLQLPRLRHSSIRSRTKQLQEKPEVPKCPKWEEVIRQAAVPPRCRHPCHERP